MGKKKSKKDELRKKDVTKLTKMLEKEYPRDFCDYIVKLRLFTFDLILKKYQIRLLFSNTGQPVLFELQEYEIILPTLQTLRKFL
ncbi:MAG: hypothetical protein ACXAC7_07780 [Candidatus Hodarchaeales archaeon]|jgi:hypothetical protein